MRECRNPGSRGFTPARWIFCEKVSKQKRQRSILLLLFLFLTGCKSAVVHDLAENQANQVIARLHEAKLEAEKSHQADGKWSVLVDQREMLPAIQTLAETHLARPERDDEPDSGSIVATQDDDRFRYERNISHEVEKTLETISGVLEARVHLHLPEGDALSGRRPEAKASASVLLLADDKVDLTQDQIASLVSGASGIGTESVHVLISHPALPAIVPLKSDTFSIPQVPTEGMIAFAFVGIGVLLAFGALMKGKRQVTSARKAL